jgi:hypothetical protein
MNWKKGFQVAVSLLWLIPPTYLLIDEINSCKFGARGIAINPLSCLHSGLLQISLGLSVLLLGVLFLCAAVRTFSCRDTPLNHG